MTGRKICKYCGEGLKFRFPFILYSKSISRGKFVRLQFLFTLRRHWWPLKGEGFPLPKLYFLYLLLIVLLLNGKYHEDKQQWPIIILVITEVKGFRKGVTETGTLVTWQLTPLQENINCLVSLGVCFLIFNTCLHNILSLKPRPVPL